MTRYNRAQSGTRTYRRSWLEDTVPGAELKTVQRADAGSPIRGQAGRQQKFSRQEMRSGHKLESATGFQEQEESNKHRSEHRCKEGVWSQAIGADNYSEIF